MSRKWAKIQEWALSESLIHYEMVEKDVENALGSSGQMQGGVGGGGVCSPMHWLMLNIHRTVRKQRNKVSPFAFKESPVCGRRQSYGHLNGVTEIWSNMRGERRRSVFYEDMERSCIKCWIWDGISGLIAWRTGPGFWVENNMGWSRQIEEGGPWKKCGEGLRHTWTWGSGRNGEEKMGEAEGVFYAIAGGWSGSINSMFSRPVPLKRSC